MTLIGPGEHFMAEVGKRPAWAKDLNERQVEGVLYVGTHGRITNREYRNHLLSTIHDHSATVAVIGLGYVGLPLAVAFAESGFPVVGIDVDPSFEARTSFEEGLRRTIAWYLTGRKING